MKRYNASDSIKAVAIGLPSMVSKDKKTVISTPNLKGFDNIPFGDTLSKKLGIPVYVDRDVNFLLQMILLHWVFRKILLFSAFISEPALGMPLFKRQLLLRTQRSGRRARAYTVSEY